MSPLNNDIPRCTRVCAQSKQPFQPGEEFYSILAVEKGEYVRWDYSLSEWTNTEKPLEIIGWWRSRVPLGNDKKIKLAPNDILLNLFDELLERPDKGEIRYVLTLLLIRRRIFRYEKEEQDHLMGPHLFVYAIRRETTYCVPIVTMDEQQINEVQEYLASLLYSIG